MRLGSECGEFLLSVDSILWCPCVVGCGYCLDTGVAVSGLVRPLCCRGVVIVGVVVVSICFVSGVDRSLGSSVSADHSGILIVGVGVSGESRRSIGH